jgi:K+-sensing histidine kinase KdpD
MQQLFHVHHVGPTLAGLAICTMAAAAVAIIFDQTPWRGIVPVVFLIVILALAIFCGTAAGIMGTLISAMIFAYWLYPPIGNLAVQSDGGRSSLAWMLLGGLVISYLLAPGFKPRDPRQR